MRLSLAMIVRDEAEVLARCLESVRGVADETIVVDTGSTDDTVAIAQRFGCRVEPFAWCDDFAAARNRSFELATAPYILWLDADDVVTPANRERLLSLKERLQHDAYYLNYDYAQDENGASTCTLVRERIVRNTPDIRWQYPVHEVLTIHGKSIEHCDITITHGRTARGAATDRHRNLRILQQAIGRSEYADVPRLAFYLGRECVDAGDDAAAIDAFERFLSMPNLWIEDRVAAWSALAGCHARLARANPSDTSRRRARAREAAHQARRLDARWAEPHIILGTLALEENDPAEAVFWFERALHPMPPLLSPVLPRLYDAIPAAQLSIAWDRLADPRRANYYNELALQRHPDDPNLLFNRGLFRSRRESASRLSFGMPRDGFAHVSEMPSLDADDIFPLDAIPQADASADAIACARVPDAGELPRVFAEWRRVLRDGGEVTLRSETSRTSAVDVLLAMRAAQLIVDYVWQEGDQLIARAVKPRSPGRTAFVCDRADLRAPQFRIRIRRIAAWLRAQGHHADLVFPDQTAGYDTLVFFREFSADELARMQRAKRSGQRVLLDVSEDLLDFPFAHYRPMVGAADAVVCCSHALAARLQPFVRQVAVIEDAVETEPETSCQYRERRRLTVGWIGMTGNERHAEKLRPLIEAAGHQLLTIHGGADADVPWDARTWPAALASCDVAIAPQDVAAEPSKSSNKVTAAMALGLPVIASPLEAYRRVIRHGENGYLASTDDEWHAALEALRARATRERIGRSGKATARAWSIDAIGAQWCALLAGQEPVVDIIIPTRGADDYLRACVASIAANSGLVHRIIAVDSAARAEQPELPVNVQWVVPERALNFAEAINRGVRASSAPFVCFLNDDTIVTRGWLEPLVEQARRTGGMCNPLSNCDRGWVHDHDLRIDGMPLLAGEHELRGAAIVRRGNGSSRIPVEALYAYVPGHARVLEREWLPFFCTLMPRAVLERVGPLDEAFATSCEDVDFNRRAALLGIPRTLDERSFVFHFGGVSRRLCPEALDDDSATARLRVKYGQPLVVIHSGIALENWTAANVENPGIGGSETAAVRMAAELRRLGHRVVVFAPTGSDDHLVDGVEYQDLARFRSFCDVQHANVFIASRDARLLEAPMRASRRYFWAHDTVAIAADDGGSDRVRRQAAALDAIFCLSDWHRDVFVRHHGVPESKVVVTRNGIDPARFASRVRRRKHRLIYSSSPDRGLDRLLRMFPRIRAAVPDAELHVFYGFDNWDRALQWRPNARGQALRDATRAALAQPGVVYHGRVGQMRLAREMLASDVWLYPTSFLETYCITAVEAQMAGVICICSSIGALRTTVGDRGILIGDPEERGYEERAVEETVALLRDRDRRRRMAIAARQWASQQTWSSLAGEWSRRFAGEIP